MKSILQDTKYDYLVGMDFKNDWENVYLEEHHIFFGNPGRKNSEMYGLKVWLSPEHHRGKISPHQDRDIDLQLKAIAQKAFETVHGSREEFVRIFGRNYLED